MFANTLDNYYWDVVEIGTKHRTECSNAIVLLLNNEHLDCNTFAWFLSCGFVVSHVKLNRVVSLHVLRI